MASPLGSGARADVLVRVAHRDQRVRVHAEQYAARLVHEGETEGSPAFATKVKAYADRLEGMNRQRLTPDVPGVPQRVLLPDEQEAQGGRELVPAAQGTAQLR